MTHSPLVFICGHRKSGTTLLANLLDGHPQLAVYPFDLTLLYAYFPEYIRTHPAPAERRARLQRIVFEELEQQLRPGALDVAGMARRFFADLPDGALADMGTLILRLMTAYQTVRSAADARWGVFKETSIEIYAAEILQWFPEARFIHLLRDPRDNFAALASGVEKHYSRLGEDHNRTLASLLHRARLGLRVAQHNSACYGKARYHLVRYEDLTAAPDREMRRIADFLGIDFDPFLLKPTVLGVPTGGNAFDGVSSFEVTGRHVDRWRERIAPEDAQVIEFHFADEMKAFGYVPVFAEAEQAHAAAEFYKWENYAYFYGDRFALSAKQ